ncbi:C2H2-type zinc finger transcription factor [Phycomyces blakesleeanus NRRL 1555(-)]|uniref:C2H2-type zinc finger transcription factor n=1 Tax=Phycomyces blakesleeanus (strain ATCC 8743b / DSM 1359 / FGSC 10004 / NBRC 33097 / NRRL 1555) TaxID=763407 RepID=A0A167PF51_PHYB8|nr:C2H2-type zinc finger transcription factor [Phycomyces blakesleeanus NRRL 1555(-)]OAD77796.1 C2H2-type zinc finger transcription factor [Phycomyces blakesleeanus NRRL 1555(-)]|eukprot:XP_018295836.1 C2H2-type zinc finger transcription factor [Phycomyces blakesleeanus NRRL 1555(-)]
MVAMASKTKLVTILQQCFECRKTYSTPQSLREHMQKHNIQLPQRITGIRRYNNDEYTYVKATKSHDDIEKHFGCPACIAHCMEIDELKTHYYANHLETLPEQSQTTSQEEPATGQQQSYNSQDQPNKRRLSNILGTELLDPLCLSFPPLDHDDHLLVQNFDATMAFHKLQLSLCQHKWKLSLENHIHCAMAATHILLLSRNQYPEDLSPYFSNHDLKATINGIETKYGIRKLPMSMATTTSMIGIAQNLTMGVISRDKAILPPVPIAEDINEFELSTRYVDPFLSGLFDDPDEGIYLRWTNEITLEARQNEDLSTKRPDICISRLHGMTWASNHGYGEVKSAAQGGNNYSICRDLLRVGIFCKNALDTHNMEGVLGLQVIGRMVTFYVLVLPSTGLYVMYELEKIKIPSCLDDLTKLIVDMPRVCRVLDTFNRICKPSVHQTMPSRHRPTITTSAFNGVFSPSQDRKRSCHLKYQHN